MLMFAAALLIAAGLAGDLEPDDAQCRVIHYAADGARSETAPSKPYAGPRPASASIASSGGSARASVSASSASSSNSSRSESTTRVSKPGRTITRTYDSKGCTVVIDERPDQGGN